MSGGLRAGLSRVLLKMQRRKHLLFMAEKRPKSRVFAANRGGFPIFRVFQGLS
jgi:hypothetical protein